MTWLRSSVRSACLLVTFVGCALPLLAWPAGDGERHVSGSAASLAETMQLKKLLDTAPLGPVATYQRLGLHTGSAVQDFYTQRQYQPVWTQAAGWNSSATAALSFLSTAAEYGLNRDTYGWSQLSALPDSLTLRATADERAHQLASFELRLTDALLRYTQHLHQGRLQPGTLAPTDQDSLATRRAVGRLLQALGSQDLTASLLHEQPQSRMYVQLQRTWSRMLRASPADSLRLMSGEQTEFRRVAINLERLRWEAAADSEYVLVNIPAYRLQVIKRGQVLQTHRVIVGKPVTPTPLIDSRIIVFVTAPEWRVPYSIAVNEMLPELQRDPSYLADNNYRLYNYKNQPVNPWRVRWSKVTPETFSYSIRQTSGRHNALGGVVFYFPNDHTVFLHDTPARSAFTQTERALSHGCVRVEKPWQLASYLLRRDGNEAALKPALTGPDRSLRRRFDLRTGLPIHIRYYTCEAENGKLVLYKDIYQQDACLREAFFTKDSTPDQTAMK
ncbi:L,D-transpeptidase family protein [Hymenobacter sp. BT491]|nr:L,D-transpeptidase family protein [Hymenobacter sp. BT491]